MLASKLDFLMATAALAGTALLGATGVAKAQESASYTITFHASWSEDTHPLNFPEFPHFSGLIGGTHHDGVSFWDAGELASPGIQAVAELGDKTLLRAEVEDAIVEGTAWAVFSGGGLSHSPATIARTFPVQATHSEVTIVSMLAPSPDWFVGVTGLDLRPGGEWIDEIVVPLVVWDAGTDSGDDYVSEDEPTVPPVPIFQKVDGPFATDPFVGTFTFTRDTTDAPELTSLTSGLLLPLSGNPVRDLARFQLQIPAGTSAGISTGVGTRLAIFDARGREIRTLQSGTPLADDQIIEWDVRSANGNRVPTGTYFLSLRAGSLSESRKVLVVR